jgi:hypothetical protein
MEIYTQSPTSSCIFCCTTYRSITFFMCTSAWNNSRLDNQITTKLGTVCTVHIKIELDSGPN